MTISEEKKCVTIFVISGSAGETTSKLAATLMAQYPTVSFTLTRQTLVKDEDKLVQVLEDAKKAEAMVLHTIINDHLVATINQSFSEHRLFHFDILTPPIAGIKRLTGVAPMRGPGALHHLDESYFRRIEAVRFTVKYDDDKGPRGLLETGVLLPDASRTSKTPLNFFLANKNLKVTNLSLILEAYLPKQLSKVDPKEIIDLTSDPNVLNEIRKERMHAYGLPENTSYSDIEKIRRELTFANGLYQKLGCIVIDVASLLIEGIASVILNTLNLGDYSYYSTETSKD